MTVNAIRDRLDQGFSLPSEWYTDPAIAEVEQRVVLRRGWHFVAHTGELPDIGDQKPYELAGVPIALVRAADGGVRGFVNICRHRAHLVVLEPRNRKALTCSYHGWTYDLDGGLKHVQRGEELETFDRASCGLVPVQVHVWGPTIWVNLALDAPSFPDWVPGLADMVVERGVDVNANRFAFERAFEFGANWKVFMDNAIECYHCPTAHPELSRIVDTDPANEVSIIGGRRWISHTMRFRADHSREYHFHWIFPTTYFQYSGTGGFDVGTIRPLGVDRIAFRHLTFVPRDMPEADVAERHERLLSDPTILQDIGICERVQAAHASGMAQPGRLLPHSEIFVRHFQRVLAEDLG